MPTIARLNLLDAIAALPYKTVVEYSLWLPAVESLPGLAQGTWGEWVELTRPYTCSKPKDSTRAITSGGEEYIKALSVYCPTDLPPEVFTPGGRTCRIRCSWKIVANVPQFRDDDVYRVMDFRTWDDVSNHCELFCRRDLGEAEGQA
jgi:hypothetical protein